MGSALLFLSLFTATTSPIPPPPAEGLSLVAPPSPIPITKPIPIRDPSPPPPTSAPGPVGGFGLMGALIAALAAFVVKARARRSRGDPAPYPPNAVDVIFVPGHGSPPHGTFDELVTRLGLAPDHVYEFDWRRVVPGVGHHRASQRARIGDAADALQAFIEEVESDGRWVYLVGHSKGGATIAQLLAGWDRHPEDRVFAVVGAALLDPPIASGWHGALQSLGRFHDAAPDDGGYDPIRRSWFGLVTEDTRRNLGRASGVEVMVIRNPDAALTNFWDEPRGLRVYDLEDGGPHALDVLVTRPSGFIDRVGEAHTTVIGHPATAACVISELWRAGACRWTGDRRPILMFGRPIRGPKTALVL